MCMFLSCERGLKQHCKHCDFWSIALEMVDRNSTIKKKSSTFLQESVIFAWCGFCLLPKELLKEGEAASVVLNSLLISPQRSHVTFLTLIHETNRYVITFPSCFQPCFSPVEFHPMPFIHVIFFFALSPSAGVKCFFPTGELAPPTAHLD